MTRAKKACFFTLEFKKARRAECILHGGLMESGPAFLRAGGRAPSLGGLAVEVERDEGVEHVGYPYGQGGWHVAIDGKRGRDGLEQDVGEAQAQADAQVESHAALGLSGREGDADEGEDGRRPGPVVPW